jgi:hypothetical protein
VTGTETIAAITPKVMTITNDALSRFKPRERDCYEDEEFYFKDLKWEQGYRYSMMNCLYQVLKLNILVFEFLVSIPKSTYY